MRFTIAKLIIATILANIVICLTFATPFYIGLPILTFLSVFVIPPFILVGAVNTRGPRQAFFLGSMVSGTPHFIVSLYFVVMLGMGFGEWGTFAEEDVGYMQYFHLIGYMLGTVGGLSGVGAYFLIADRPQGKTEKLSGDQKEKSKPSSPFDLEFSGNSDEEVVSEEAVIQSDENELAEAVSRSPK